MNGREAYEQDVRGCPLYHDGSPRVGWNQLCEVARYSWDRNPTPRNTQPVPGTFFPFPDGMTCEDMARSRSHWGTDRTHAPLAVGPGVVAWGRPLPINFIIAEAA